MKNNQLTIVDYEKIEKKPLNLSWRNNSGVVITIPELNAEIRGAEEVYDNKKDALDRFRAEPVSSRRF